MVDRDRFDNDDDGDDEFRGPGPEVPSRRMVVSAVALLRIAAVESMIADSLSGFF
jgi:hypothetical protein